MGEHMLPVIDAMKIDVACVGNHDYDYGIPEFQALVDKLNHKFPWLLSNLTSPITKQPIVPGIEYYFLEVSGLKVFYLN